jgi:general stress protein YciG
MSGTQEGGYKARETNLGNNPDFYKEIGALGGKKSRGGGFSKATEEQRAEWGHRGGKKSRRKKEY